MLHFSICTKSFPIHEPFSLTFTFFSSFIIRSIWSQMYVGLLPEFIKSYFFLHMDAWTCVYVWVEFSVAVVHSTSVLEFYTYWYYSSVRVTSLYIMLYYRDFFFDRSREINLYIFFPNVFLFRFNNFINNLNVFYHYLF